VYIKHLTTFHVIILVLSHQSTCQNSDYLVPITALKMTLSGL